MKSLSKRLKQNTILLSILMLIYSCSIYQNSPTTVDNALKTGKKVKVEFKNNKAYKFIRLAKDTKGELYGIAANNSKPSNAFPDQISAIGTHSQNVKILLKNDQINNVYFEDHYKIKRNTKLFIGSVVLGGLAVLVVNGLNNFNILGN